MYKTDTLNYYCTIFDDLSIKKFKHNVHTWFKNFFNESEFIQHLTYRFLQAENEGVGGAEGLMSVLTSSAIWMDTVK